MDIYDYNAALEAYKLTPPMKRQTNNLAWLGVYADKIQYLHDLFLVGYAKGSSAANWISGNPYVYLDRVVYIDYAVYECISLTGVTSATTPDVDKANWIKVLDTFVGVRERAHYTGQLLILEYILNKQFQVAGVSIPWTGASHSTQIYIANSFNPSSQFWLSNGGTGAITSYLSKSGSAQKYFLGNSYSYSQYAFTLYVPSAIATIINNNQVSGSGITYDQVIRQTADKYVQSGFLYNITTY